MPHTLISQFIQKHTVGESKPDHRDLYFLLRHGPTAEMFRSQAIIRMRKEPWFQHHKASTGSEPVIPAAPKLFG